MTTTENKTNARPFEKINHETTMFAVQLQNSKDVAECMELLYGNNETIKDLNREWCREYINNLIGCYNVSERLLANMCRTEQKVVRKWSSAPPINREDYVALCCFFGLGAETCSRMMRRFGELSELDPHNMDDVIYIQLLNITDRQDFGDEAKQNFYRDHRDLYFTIRDQLLSDDVYDHYLARRDLKILKDTTFENALIKAKGFHIPKLVEFNEAIDEFYFNTGYHSVANFIKVAPTGNLSDTYRKRTFGELAKEEIDNIPKRKYLLSFFLHMGLPLQKIDEFFITAGLEKLCAKNPFEAALIYTLSEIYKEYPYLASNKVMFDERNIKAQKKLPSGSVYMEVYNRLSSEPFHSFFQTEGIDLDKEMCFNLVEPRGEK